MIRELMVNGAKNIPANYAAKVAMVTGMGVQVDHKAGQVKFPDAATAEGIEMVAHEFIPEGIYASQTNFDDYDKMVTKIEAGALASCTALTSIRQMMHRMPISASCWRLTLMASGRLLLLVLLVLSLLV